MTLVLLLELSRFACAAHRGTPSRRQSRYAFLWPQGSSCGWQSMGTGAVAVWWCGRVTVAQVQSVSGATQHKWDYRHMDGYGKEGISGSISEVGLWDGIGADLGKIWGWRHTYKTYEVCEACGAYGSSVHRGNCGACEGQGYSLRLAR